MRKTLTITTLISGLLLTACGGGSANGSSSTNGSAGIASSGSNPTIGNTTSAPNVVPIIVDNGSTGQSPDNTPFVTVTVCNSNDPTNCQTIDHIILDTGSMGLRIFANKLNSNLGLANANIGGSYTAECILFGSGYDWGSVALATVKIGGEAATNIPVQVINDPTAPPIPASCSNEGAYNDLGGANGIIGVNPLPYDNGNYYSCSGDNCNLNSAVANNQQIVSPVYAFATDNNGVIVNLPNVPSGGATSLVGTLTFGLGTKSNNAVTATNIFTSNGSALDGSFTTTYDNGRYDSIFDTGSTELFFDTPSNKNALTVCSAAPSFYCPLSPTMIQTQLYSLSGGNTVNFNYNIINWDQYTKTNPTSVAIPNAGATGGNNFFIWGLPFFYGRTVYSAFNQASTPVGNGPFFAF